MGELVDISLNPVVIIELAKAKNMLVDDALELVPEIHSGYCSKVLYKAEKGKEDD